MNPVVAMKVRHGERLLAVTGRKAFTLAKLIERGDGGMTAFDDVGPRLSHYVFGLRRDGITIETVPERHGGPFAGEHARYVLRSPLSVMEVTRQHGRAA